MLSRERRFNQGNVNVENPTSNFVYITEMSLDYSSQIAYIHGPKSSCGIFTKMVPLS